jgi:hypothetical protein
MRRHGEVFIEIQTGLPAAQHRTVQIALLSCYLVVLSQMVERNHAWPPKLKDERQEIGNFPLNLVAIINTLLLYFNNKYAITLVRKQKSYIFSVITAS